ncbi:hypothetical protein BH10BAC4_BH10BAC4_18820 [soil metagenome]
MSNYPKLYSITGHVYFKLVSLSYCHFLLFAQKKVTKEKGTTNAAHLPAFGHPLASALTNTHARFAPLPPAGGTPTRHLTLVDNRLGNNLTKSE